jgi:hypothetical protein
MHAPARTRALARSQAINRSLSALGNVVEVRVRTFARAAVCASVRAPASKCVCFCRGRMRAFVARAYMRFVRGYQPRFVSQQRM